MKLKDRCRPTLSITIRVQKRVFFRGKKMVFYSSPDGVLHLQLGKGTSLDDVESLLVSPTAEATGVWPGFTAEKQ